MKLKIHLLILILSLSLSVGAQEKYPVNSNYKGLSFTEFVSKVESILPVKFFYLDEWVKDLKLADYPDCNSLQCLMDNIFKGTTLYYYIDSFGNVVITSNYSVKITTSAGEINSKFLTPSDYSG